MGIFKKISDLARANINALIDHLEDPQKLAGQAALDLRESKQKAEQLLVKLMATLAITEKRLISLPQEIRALTERAENFLKQNDDDNAKDALKKKQQLDQELIALTSEISTEKQAIASIKKGIAAIDKKVDEDRRMASLDATKAQLEKEDAFSTFSRMEEKIESLEYDVQALNDLVLDHEKNDSAKTSAPSFDKFSDPALLEQELLAIKKKLKG